MSYDGGLNYGHINQAMAVCMTPDCKFLQSPTLLTANQNMVTVVLDPDDFIWKSPSKAVLFKHWEEQRKEQETKRWKLLDKATE